MQIVVMFTPSFCALICPKSTSITPCSCLSYDTNNNSTRIDCYNKTLNDLKLSSILNAFLATGLSPVIYINASYNQLNTIPNQISKFPSLSVVNLSFNKISLLSAGAFNLTKATYVEVVLNNNSMP